jgi:glycosyltransferase involved in cell wall biosynthesis
MAISKVSVIMSVYNDEEYVQEAVDSILNQTFKDFEFIIINDGSTDRTLDILQSYNDDRVILLNNEKNIGLVKSLNRGLENAKGQYIARADGDDISFPNRFEKQIRFLDEHPNVGLISSSAIIIDATGNEIEMSELATENEEIRTIFLKGNCIWHTSSIFKSDCVKKVGKYREWFRNAEDYDLWLRLIKYYDVANIGDPLCKVRIVNGSMSTGTEKEIEQMEYQNFARLFAEQRRLYGYDELEKNSKNWFFMKSLNSRFYFNMSKRHHTDGMRWDPGLTKKYLVKSLISNPLNYNAWYYAVSISLQKLKNKISIEN